MRVETLLTARAVPRVDSGRRQAGRALALSALVLACSACGSIARSIDIARLPGPDGRALVPPTLTGYLVRPEGDGPFPAVVLLHGCSGLGLETSHQAWWKAWLLDPVVAAMIQAGKLDQPGIGILFVVALEKAVGMVTAQDLEKA